MLTFGPGFGTFCYVSFGDKTADLITSNLPSDNKMVVLMQVFYCVSLFFTYPIMLFPCLQVIENLVLNFCILFPDSPGFVHLEMNGFYAMKWIKLIGPVQLLYESAA